MTGKQPIHNNWYQSFENMTTNTRSSSSVSELKDELHNTIDGMEAVVTQIKEQLNNQHTKLGQMFNTLQRIEKRKGAGADELAQKLASTINVESGKAKLKTLSTCLPKIYFS